MLKIKGLKKKKKGKKSKRKEEELFEAAELEEYRKEQQRKQEELKEKGLETHEDDEEWQKFKLLTSGVDDILKKTQGDLDRIKSTSFFQKKSPVPSEPNKETEKKPGEKPERPRDPVREEKKWVGFEEGDSSLTVEEPDNQTETPCAESSKQEAKPDFFTEEEESEEEDDLDDLFDTSYVDAVESGEVVLAYIPDSPTQEDDGYDPFDTSIVDKVISVKDQKKALVTLGSAVEVLSGIVDKPVAPQESSPFKSSKRRRPRPQDLLLGSFDESQPSTTPVQIAVEPAPKSILDDDPIFEDQTSETLGFAPVTPVVEVKSSVVPRETNTQSPGFNLRNLVDEFVSPVTPSADLQNLQLTEPVNEVDDFDDEFAALAAESLSKDVSKGKPPPRPAPPAADKKLVPGNDLNDDDEEDLEDDPFDTTFADKVLPGKYELKIIEKEVLQDHVQEDTTNIVQNKINEVLKNSDLSIKIPKNKFQETFEEDDIKLLSPSKRDLLGGSTTDLSSIGQNPIQPESITNKNNASHYSDPFDTSVIDSLVAPKKTELKYLEKELLVDQYKGPISSDPVDDDFDPRADETTVPSRPDSLVVAPGKRVSVPKIVAFDVKNGGGADLLAVDQEESLKIGKPLTPYYTDKNIVEENLTSESDADPFDTSFVNSVPGKVELKLLENELVGDNAPQEDISDPDFDPRALDTDAAPIVEEKKQEELRPDIISEDVSSDIKLHTPVIPRKIEDDLKEEEDIDPFDTSTVSNLAPGKAEIKIIEKELIESGNVPLQSSDNSSEVVKSLLEKAKKQSTSSDTDLLAQTHDDDTSKPLTPIPADLSLEDDDYDPFDTSAVQNILPDTEQLAQPPLSFNPFLSSNEFTENSNATDNPFLSSFTANQDPSATDASNTATNPFSFGEENSASDFFSMNQNDPPAVNYENIFSSVSQNAPQVPSTILANTNESLLINDDSFMTSADLEAASELRDDASTDYDNQKGPPRRPPPPRPLPPRETTELIKTVTGAMEATSSHLLDRLQATRTPSPTPMRDLHSPSPTQFGDLLEVDEPFSAFAPDNQPQDQTHIASREINLMDDFDFSSANNDSQPTDLVQNSNLISTGVEKTNVPSPSPITPPPTPATLPYQQQPPLQSVPTVPEPLAKQEEQPIESLVFAPIEQAPSPVTPVQQVVAAPPVSRPPPPTIPQRPKPPPQPPRPAPPAQPPQVEPKLLPTSVEASQEITKDEGFADVFGVTTTHTNISEQKEAPAENLEKASNIFEATFEDCSVPPNDQSLVQDLTSQNALDDNVNYVPDNFVTDQASVAQTNFFPEPEKSSDIFSNQDNNSTDFFSEQSNVPNDIFTEENKVPTNIFGETDTSATNIFSNAAPIPQQTYNIFDSAPPPTKAQDAFDAFEAKFESVPQSQTKIEPGNAFDPFGVGSSGHAGDATDGFGADESFDAFLALGQPPPVPQGTPARVSRGQSAESDSGNDFNVFIKPKDEESEKYTPVALPPPKSPQSSTMFQDTSPRFNPFDNAQESAASAAQNMFAQEAAPEIPFKQPERTDSQETPPTPLFDEDVSQPLEEFPRINYDGPGWEMHLRQPNKKKITGQRFWKKIWVKLVYQGENPVLQLFNGKDDKDPFQELPLQPCYSVSDIGAQQFDQYGKIFTIKLQFIFYKERPGVRPGQVTKAERLTNKLSQFAAYAIQGDYQGCKEFGSDLRKLGLPVEHAPQISQLFKLGSFSYDDMKQICVVVEEALFKLSAHRDRALNYKMEEVQITAVDELFVDQNAYGGVLKQIARVRLFFLGFLSGMPDVEIGVNDLVRQGKEVVGRHDIIPVVTEEWIRLEHVEFHSCIQQDEYERTKTIKLKPPDACYIELMRFRVRPPKNRELPLQVKATMCVNGNKVDLRSDVLVPGFTSRKLGQIPCEDVMIKFPIPECWIYLFRVEKHFRYGSVKSAHRRTGKVKGIERFLGAVDNMEPSLMEVTSGQAKYEHQHRAIVWRIPRLPKEGQGAYTTHNFVCRMALTSYDQIPEELAKYCYVEFTMPATTVSHMTVRSVSISNSDSDTPPEKYVRQLSRHEYRVEIEHTQAEGPGDYIAVAKTTPAPVPEEPPPPVVPAQPDSDSDSSG